MMPRLSKPLPDLQEMTRQELLACVQSLTSTLVPAPRGYKPLSAMSDQELLCWKLLSCVLRCSIVPRLTNPLQDIEEEEEEEMTLTHEELLAGVLRLSSLAPTDPIRDELGEVAEYLAADLSDSLIDKWKVGAV